MPKRLSQSSCFLGSNSYTGACATPSKLQNLFYCFNARTTIITIILWIKTPSPPWTQQPDFLQEGNISAFGTHFARLTIFYFAQKQLLTSFRSKFRHLHSNQLPTFPRRDVALFLAFWSFFFTIRQQSELPLLNFRYATVHHVYRIDFGFPTIMVLYPVTLSATLEFAVFGFCLASDSIRFQQTLRLSKLGWQGALELRNENAYFSVRWKKLEN